MKHRIILFESSQGTISVSLFTFLGGDPKKVESWEPDAKHYKTLKKCFEDNGLNPSEFRFVDDDFNPVTLQNF